MIEEYKPRSREELTELNEMLDNSIFPVTKEWFHSQVDKIKREKEQAK
jgi:hypothetical protein